MICNKCNGKGIIQGFSHVAGGKCFKCNGSGTIPEPKPGSFTAAMLFIKQYEQRGFFPENFTGETIAVLAHEGHPTAEKKLMIDGEFMYIGQPVCRSSDWYKIPATIWDEFLLNYNKAFKKWPILLTAHPNII